MTQEFILDVLGIIAKADAHRALWWRTDGEYAPITFFINCNDTFFWGCADAEDVTPENIEVLRKAYDDSKYHGDILFCARVREMRPQGAMYDCIRKEDWHLFDACGPEREVGFGNPCAPGES